MQLEPCISISSLIHFSMGVPGIESAICGIFQDLGYKTLNPCCVLKIYHNHCGVKMQGLKASSVNLRLACSPRPTHGLFWGRTQEAPNNGVKYCVNNKGLGIEIDAWVHQRCIANPTMGGKVHKLDKERIFIRVRNFCNSCFVRNKAKSWPDTEFPSESGVSRCQKVLHVERDD